MPRRADGIPTCPRCGGELAATDYGDESGLCGPCRSPKTARAASGSFSWRWECDRCGSHVSPVPSSRKCPALVGGPAPEVQCGGTLVRKKVPTPTHPET